MIKQLLKLLFLFVIGWIIYVQFWGTADEKALRQNLFENVRETGKNVGSILKNSKDKVQDGSFDDALSKIGTSIGTLKDQAQNMGKTYSTRLKTIEEKKDQLDNLLEKLNLKKEDETEGAVTEREQKVVSEKIEQITDSLKGLVNDMEEKEEK